MGGGRGRGGRWASGRLLERSGGRAGLLCVLRGAWMRAPMALDLEKQRAPSPGRPGSPASSERRLKVTADGAQPREQQQAAQAAPTGASAGSAPPLKFSIERILSSEFGPAAAGRTGIAGAVTAAKEPRKDDRQASKPPPTSPGPNQQGLLWPAWVYCTRYSDRPSSGEPVSRRARHARMPL